MANSSDRKALARERADSQFKAGRPRLQLILSGHWRSQWLEMRRYDRTALLGKSMQQRDMTLRIPTPSGSEQGHAGWLRRFEDQNLE
jgi:hypothetical protein